jgi:hypothetical protein
MQLNDQLSELHVDLMALHRRVDQEALRHIDATRANSEELRSIGFRLERLRALTEGIK